MVEVDKVPLRECASPVCSTMVCSNCGECPNRCGFDQGEPSPHDECVIGEVYGGN